MAKRQGRGDQDESRSLFDSDCVESKDKNKSNRRSFAAWAARSAARFAQDDTAVVSGWWAVEEQKQVPRLR